MPPFKCFLNKLIKINHGLKTLQTEPHYRAQRLSVRVARTWCCQRDLLSCGYFPEGSMSDHITRVA